MSSRLWIAAMLLGMGTGALDDESDRERKAYRESAERQRHELIVQVQGELEQEADKLKDRSLGWAERSAARRRLEEVKGRLVSLEQNTSPVQSELSPAALGDDPLQKLKQR